MTSRSPTRPVTRTHGFRWLPSFPLFLVLVMLAVAGSTVSCSRPSVLAPLGPTPQEWHAFSDGSIIVYTYPGRHDPQEIALEVQQARAIAAHFTGYSLPKHAPLARFFLVSNNRDHWHFADTRDRHFVRTESPSGARYVLDGRKLPGTLRRDLIEAVVHHHLQSFEVPAPVWYQIGFGALLERLELDYGRLTVGKLNPSRLLQLWDARSVTVKDVLEPGRLLSMSPTERRGHDALAWLMVHYLTIDLDGKTGLTPAQRLTVYGRAMRNGATPAQALEASWGLTPKQLAQRTRAMASDGLRAPRIALDSIPGPRPVVEFEIVSGAEIAYQMAELFQSLGDRERAEREFSRATRIDLRHGRAWAGLARALAAKGRIAEALERADRAVEESGGNPRVLAARGVVQTYAAARAPESERESLLDGARQDLELALTLEPKNGYVLWAHANTWLSVDGQSPEAALDSLERAYRVDPPNRTIRLALLDGYTRTGRIRDAQRVAGSLRSDARTPQDLEKIDARMARIAEADLPPWRRSARSNP